MAFSAFSAMTGTIEQAKKETEFIAGAKLERSKAG
jgi:hypothetical protein